LFIKNDVLEKNRRILLFEKPNRDAGKDRKSTFLRRVEPSKKCFLHFCGEKTATKNNRPINAK
jgi:hypothetical protein